MYCNVLAHLSLFFILKDYMKRHNVSCLESKKENKSRSPCCGNNTTQAACCSRYDSCKGIWWIPTFNFLQMNFPSECFSFEDLFFPEITAKLSALISKCTSCFVPWNMFCHKEPCNDE